MGETTLSHGRNHSLPWEIWGQSVPGNVAAGATGGRVLPAGLAEVFTSSLEAIGRVNSYADGRSTRVNDSTISRKRFAQTRALGAAAMGALQAFVEVDLAAAFFFYNTLEGPHDPTGVATAGRYKVTRESEFSREARMGRDRATFALVEVF